MSTMMMSTTMSTASRLLLQGICLCRQFWHLLHLENLEISLNKMCRLRSRAGPSAAAPAPVVLAAMPAVRTAALGQRRLRLAQAAQDLQTQMLVVPYPIALSKCSVSCYTAVGSMLEAS